MSATVLFASRLSMLWLTTSIFLTSFSIAPAQQSPQAQEGAKTTEDQKKAADKVPKTQIETSKPLSVVTRDQAADSNRAKVSIQIHDDEVRKAEIVGDWNKASMVRHQTIDLARQENKKEVVATESLKYAR